MTIRPPVGRWLPTRFLLPALAFVAVLRASPQPVQLAGDTPEAESPVLPSLVLPATSPFNEERIMMVMPDYATVRDSSRPVAPLTARQKWLLAEKETLDPFNFATAFLTAAESQAGNQTPRYGEGWANYGRRLGAAQLDFATQNYFSAGVLATLLHQDPRYFRKGPHSKIVTRAGYAIACLFIARQDSGREAFNASNIGGTLLGIGASNAYYPSASRNGEVMVSRIWTSLMGGAVGNLMSEFWPDVQQKFFSKHSK